MPRAVPVIVVAPVTAAVTDGPLPPMVMDVALTARTRPVRMIRSCPFPLPPGPGRAGRFVPPPPGAAVPPGAVPPGADAPGVADPAVLAVGVPPTSSSPTATPAAAASTATAAAAQTENPGTPPCPQRFPVSGAGAGP